MRYNLLSGGLILVGGNSHRYLLTVEFGEEFRNSGIRHCGVGAVLVIMLAEIDKQPVDGLGFGVGLCPFQELAHTVAHHKLVGRNRMRGEPHLLKGVVAGGSEIGDGVEQSAVKVKYYQFLHYCCNFLFCCGSGDPRRLRLKGIADREMEGMVTTPFRMDERPRLRSPRRIMGLHTHVETEQEVSEVESKTETVGSGYLFIERIEMEHSSGLIGIIVDRPDIAGVDKESEFKQPKEPGSIFHRKVETYVAALVDEVAHGVGAGEGSGAERAHIPSADTVGAPTVEAFLKRKDRGVAVGYSDAETDVAGKEITVVEIVEISKIGISLYILSIPDAKHLIRIGMEIRTVIEGRRDAKQKIAGRLGVDTYGVYVRLEASSPRAVWTLVGVIEAIGEAHYEMVLIAVSEQGIVGRDLVDEVVGTLGEIDIVYVERCEGVSVTGDTLGPSVTPAGGRDDAGVFGPFLIVHRYVKLGDGVDTPLEPFSQERGLELREIHTEIKRVFHISVVEESLQVTAQRLIGPSDFGRQGLRPLADISMGIAHRGGHAEVSLRVRSLKLEGHRLTLPGGKKNIGVEKLLAVDIGHRNETDVDELEDTEA